CSINWACSSFLNSAIQLNLNFCIINVFNKKNKKTPARYGAYCLACGTERIVLHKTKQVCRFVGIVTYCLHKAEQAVACTKIKRTM
ncbi:MAG: hypothetical protein WBJ59_08500, partial [Dysgonamonadaceae bacterium]